MNEMKKTQDDPVGSWAVSMATNDKGGSFDNGDPNTTNLYIGNIAPSVTGVYSEKKLFYLIFSDVILYYFVLYCSALRFLLSLTHAC